MTSYSATLSSSLTTSNGVLDVYQWCQRDAFHLEPALHYLCVVLVQIYKPTLLLWSALWRRRGRGAGQRGKGEKNSITHWWWGQATVDPSSVQDFWWALIYSGCVLLQELRGNIRVHCRVRPVLPFDHVQSSFAGARWVNIRFVPPVWNKVFVAKAKNNSPVLYFIQPVCHHWTKLSPPSVM